MPPYRPAIDRFTEKYIPEPNSGCWLWIASVSITGYGQFSLNNKCVGAHRFSYEYFVGSFKKGMHIDHLCRVVQCVNPDHLEMVTPRVNNLRGVSLPAQNAKKTHCYKGHEFTEDNTRRNKLGWRWCRTCQKEYRKTHWRAEYAAKRKRRMETLNVV